MMRVKWWLATFQDLRVTNKTIGLSFSFHLARLFIFLVLPKQTPFTVLDQFCSSILLCRLLASGNNKKPHERLRKAHDERWGSAWVTGLSFVAPSPFGNGKVIADWNYTEPVTEYDVKVGELGYRRFFFSIPLFLFPAHQHLILRTEHIYVFISMRTLDLNDTEN